MTSTSTNTDYSDGYNDGYRSGLQKARDAIAAGDLATREQMDELRSVIQRAAAELDAQLQAAADTGGASYLIDSAADIVTRLQKEHTS